MSRSAVCTSPSGTLQCLPAARIVQSRHGAERRGAAPVPRPHRLWALRRGATSGAAAAGSLVQAFGTVAPCPPPSTGGCQSLCMRRQESGSLVPKNSSRHCAWLGVRCRPPPPSPKRRRGESSPAAPHGHGWGRSRGGSRSRAPHSAPRRRVRRLRPDSRTRTTTKDLAAPAQPWSRSGPSVPPTAL